MFIDHEEEIWAMGRGIFGHLDEGWLRKLKKPAGCGQIKKAKVLEFGD